MLRRRGGESGNVMLAMPILMAVTLLGVVLFADSQRALDQSRVDTDDSRAAAAAELAVHEAFARIDAGETRGFSGSGNHDDADYEYDADSISAQSWEVHARGTSGTIVRRLVATISREAQRAYNLFAAEELSLDQNTGRISGRVGTNGTMTVFGPSPGAEQELYRPDGSCTGCLNPVSLAGPRVLAEIEEPDGKTQRCPKKGIFTRTVNAKSGRPFICDDDDITVEFVGDMAIRNPPLVLYVASGVELVFDGANANVFGRAADFQVFVDGDEEDDVDSISATGTDIIGVIYAPGRSLATDSLDLVGSLTVRTLTVPRAGRVSISPDATLDGLAGGGPWRIVALGPDHS